MRRNPVKPARRFSIVVLVPLLLGLLGAWQFTRGGQTAASMTAEADGLAARTARVEAVARVTPMRIVHFQGDEMGYSASVAAGMMRDGAGVLRRDILVAKARQWLAGAAIAGAGASLCAGLVGLLVAAWAGRRSRVSRAALDAAFARVRALLPVLLGTQIAGLALTIGCALLFEVTGAWFATSFSRIEGQAIAVGLAVAGFVLWLGWLTLRELRRSLAAFTPSPMPLFGREIHRHEAPGLWSLIATASHGQSAVLPEHVVVGLVDGFFVTASAVALSPAETLLEGRTLHLPLPALGVLDMGETLAVIAHELAHFAGEDTAYGQRFMPTYAGITRNLDAMSLVNGPAGVRWTQAPAFTLGLHMLHVFDAAVMQWSRERELAADAASVASSGAAAAASALLRTNLIAVVTDRVMADTLAHPRAAPPDLVAGVAEQAASGLADPASLVREDAAEPGDSHPAPLRRIAALGVPIDAALLARAARPPLPHDAAEVHGLFADWDGLCATLSREAIGFATVKADTREADLREIVADTPAGSTALFQDIKRLAIVWGAVSAVCLAAGAGLALLLARRPLHDPSALPMLALVAVGLFALAALAAARVLALRRSARTPFMTLHEDGFECRGLDRIVPWAGVDRVNITTGRELYVFFHLLPITPVPKRLSGWSIRVGRRRPVVTLLNLRPVGLTQEAYQQLIQRYWFGARARAALAEAEAGPDAQPPAYVAIVSADQLGL